jgi:hypothetical protein
MDVLLSPAVRPGPQPLHDDLVIDDPAGLRQKRAPGNNRRSSYDEEGREPICAGSRRIQKYLRSISSLGARVRKIRRHAMTASLA